MAGRTSNVINDTEICNNHVIIVISGKPVVVYFEVGDKFQGSGCSVLIVYKTYGPWK
jgi:hypothetical protein